MIIYNPFWKTLEKQNISTYTLIHKYKVSGSTITRLKHNLPLSTTTLNHLCRILNCRLDEIAVYIPEVTENKD